jgi:hypothetical protein
MMSADVDDRMSIDPIEGLKFESITQCWRMLKIAPANDRFEPSQILAKAASAQWCVRRIPDAAQKELP